MPTYYYSEISVGGDIENFSENRGLWNDYMPMYSFINWRNVKCVARRYLTPKQYVVFVLSGERGMRQREMGNVLGKSGQAAGGSLSQSIKKLKKIFKKYFQNRVYMRGGFKEHILFERKMRQGVYYERFKFKKNKRNRL